MTLKKIKEVCKCDHCGSEAEMVITCSLKADDDLGDPPATQSARKPSVAAGKTKGLGVCSHCGNESEIWVDI